MMMVDDDDESNALVGFLFCLLADNQETETQSEGDKSSQPNREHASSDDEGSQSESRLVSGLRLVPLFECVYSSSGFIKMDNSNQFSWVVCTGIINVWR